MGERKFYRLIEWVFFLVICGILFLNLYLDERFGYVFMNQKTVSNYWFALGAAVFLLISFVVSKIKYKRKLAKEEADKKPADKKTIDEKPLDVKRVRLTLLTFTLLLFIIELLISYNLYFETGWDCRRVVEAAKKLAFEGVPIGDAYYFSACGNNVFLVFIFSGILRVAGLFSNNVDQFPLIVVSCMLLSASGFFMGDIIRMYTNKRRYVYGFYGIFFLLAGLSPWMVIAYSDTYAILFPVLVLWIYLVKKNKDSIPAWLAMTFLTMVGYFIKPTVLLVYLVIVFFDVLHSLIITIRKKQRGFLKSIGFWIAGALLGAVLALSLNALSNRVTGYTPEPGAKLGAAHYFMIGQNYSSGGGYNQADANLSATFHSNAERNKFNIETGINRIREMGVKKYLTFLTKKSLSNFNDGSFAWGFEGDFYWTYYEKDNVLATLVRNWYYHNGSDFNAFLNTTQCMWIFVLVFMSLTAFQSNVYTSHGRIITTVSSLAIMVFIMVFEARARYLFLYTPILITQAALGLESFLNREGKKHD